MCHPTLNRNASIMLLIYRPMDWSRLWADLRGFNYYISLQRQHISVLYNLSPQRISLFVQDLYRV